MSIATRARRGLAAVAAAGIVAPALALFATAAPAHASSTITNAQFRWGFNNESNNAGFAPGTMNLFSAGIIGNPGAGGATLSNADSGATWSTGAAAGWKASDGNVVIEKKQSDGTYATATWAGTKTAADGSAVTVSGGKFSDHQVVINNGTGTLDAAADDADITWDGDFTALYYSGMTYFTVTDPHLAVDDGVGTVTATVGGYAADMNDLTKWNALPSRTVTLATLSNVDVTTSGINVTPDYVDVAYDAGSYTPQTAKTSTNAAYWGSFPQSFVDFQQLTGSSSYWYASGGSADSRKVPLPLQVNVALTPKVTVDKTTLSADGSTVVTVTGTGFDPDAATATRPPLSGKAAGVYVAFGKYAATWKPSAGAPSTARKNATGGGLKWAVPAASMTTIGGPDAGAIELSADGSFTAQVTVDKATLDTAATDASLVNYGIYTYAGSGATQAAYETYTPITFPSVKVSQTSLPDSKVSTVTVTGTGFTPSAAIGARPPLSGSAAGVYVAFGKYAATWKPSAGAPSTARKNATGGGLKWAVPAASMTTIGGPDAGAIELSADGSFTAQVTVDKATLDTAATDASLVNYGIYTYPGSGATQAAYETYTPITFQARPTPNVAVSAPDSTYGTPAIVKATVEGATGDVTLTGAGDPITKALVDGVATFELPADLAAGSYDLTASYEGDSDYANAAGTETLDVAKAAAEVTVDAPGSTYGKAAVVKATVADATGDVKLTGAGDSLTEALVDGVATFELPADLAAGSHELTLAYQGDDNHNTASKTATLVVAKVNGQLTVTGATSKTYGAASSLVIKAPGSGTVTVAGLGTTKTLSLVDGAATFEIPADLPVGVSQGTVTYSGDATHLGSAAAVAVTVTKAAVSVTPPAATTKVKIASKSVIVVKVGGPTGAAAPTGKVKAVLKHGKKTIKLKAVTVKNGEVRLKITKKQAKQLTKGTWKLTASYAGDGSFESWSKTVKVKVKK